MNSQPTCSLELAEEMRADQRLEPARCGGLVRLRWGAEPRPNPPGQAGLHLDSRGTRNPGRSHAAWNGRTGGWTPSPGAKGSFLVFQFDCAVEIRQAHLIEDSLEVACHGRLQGRKLLGDWNETVSTSSGVTTCQTNTQAQACSAVNSSPRSVSALARFRPA